MSGPLECVLNLSLWECYCSFMHHPLLFLQPGGFGSYRVGYLSTRTNAKHSHLWNLHWLKPNRKSSRVSSGKAFASAKHFGPCISINMLHINKFTWNYKYCGLCKLLPHLSVALEPWMWTPFKCEIWKH